MFATAVVALIPSLQLLAAPILCHPPYSHGAVHVHGYTYGTTSGYSIFLRCANAQRQERGTSVFAVAGLLSLLRLGRCAADASVLANGRWIARGPDPVDQLTRLADLRDRGVLTDDEFAAQKAKLLAQS